ncbi:PAS domain S-box protein [Geitlerinema sp. PCC 9228]|uniref:PAS domain-containing sensor histidine kinase n=1 Tax=Geitlerinema sp. PCC 9228 TaxID=111611 RepID=UPI0008F99A46|nr:PAS domain S-box protein [Geitlerinema sp. PCC 9228]
METRRALQDSERILRAILDNTPVPIYLKDLEGRLILSNLTHQQTLNASQWEILGKTDYELLPKAIADEVRKNDEKVLNAGASLEMEEKIPQENQVRTYLSIKFPLCTEDGSPYAVGGISTDITDRKQAEEELGQYKEHLEDLVEQRTAALKAANEELKRTQGELERIFNFSLDILAVVNQNGYFEKISPAVTKILGYTPEEFLEMPFVELLHPDDREAATQEFYRLMETQEPTFDFVNRLIGKDGKYRWLAWNATPATTEGMVYGVARDITAVKEAEEALQEEQERFRATFEQAPVGIAHVGVAGNFLRLNQKFCDIVGYTQADMLSMRFQDLTHPEDLPANTEYMQQLLAGQIDTFSLEKRHLHKDGFAVWVNATVSLVREVSGEPKYFIAIVQDISDRKQAELALQESEAQLRQKAEELQATLEELQRTQTQLVQSEKMSGLGQLVAGVAHEINNPVNFIYGNLEHLTEYATDLLELVQQYQQEHTDPSEDLEELIEEKDVEFLAEDLPKMLDSMQMGAKRIREIVKSLRTFSRMDEAEVKAVDLHEGIDSTLTILHNRLKFKSDRPGIHVVREYGEIPPVECYPGQLNQVFMNLFGNAIDALDEYSQENPQACEESRGEIYITTQLLEGDRVRIRIRDNGPGIPEEVQQRIFDPFFTTKPVGKGTGMGLAISYQIITEKHRGRLQCCSHPGEGTAFIIEIPLHQKQAT